MGRMTHTHLQAFQTQMYINGGNDPLSCKLSPGTLQGVAMHWLATLPPRSIRVKHMDVADLFDIRQAKGETLKSYLARFNNATVWTTNWLVQQLPSVEEAAKYGGDKDMCREAHRGRRGPSQLTRGQATVQCTGAQARIA
ncbi:hypothetical protein CR513_49673, partial [Mucuna pruriens]